MTNPLIAIRQALITGPLLNWVRGVLPPLSDTEREALEAGTVWWDAELFSGKPDWARLSALPTNVLTEEEQAFVDGPVEELCRMLDDWAINFKIKKLPPEVWSFLREKGFFGMIIPKAYGGLEFSATAHSAVVTKIATRSIAAAVTVMVPNSLGPGELLLHYGTDEQKDYYLPRLASGKEVPCFGLTSPEAGSDAAAMKDRGIVCYQDVDGKKTLGMRVTWQKRYITLGPVSTLLGLAFKLYDPDHILGEKDYVGITVALVPTDTPGVNIGRRHYPAFQVFQNGPNSGDDVFIPMDWVIGGQKQVGTGWKMLMTALSAGRAVSLPSLSTGAAKLAARTTGAYARVREQFNVPIGKFEGVQEALARIAGQAYLIESGKRITTAVIDQGGKPAVMSAILKYHATEGMRQAINDAMDIHAGKGIIDGPRNYLGNAYRAIPVGITVEGANILTRSLIIFGQGAIRCHPYLLKEIFAAQNPDRKQGVKDFDAVFFKHMGFQIATFFRAFWHNLTGGRFAGSPKAGYTEKYYRQISRYAASLAFISEFILINLGGALKRKEMLSGRLGDILSALYLLSCVLKRFEDDGRPEEDLPLVKWCCVVGFYNIQESLDQVLQNYPSRFMAFLMRLVVFPLSRHRRPASDELSQACADLLIEPSATRDRLTSGIYLGEGKDPIAELDRAFERVAAAADIQRRLKDAKMTDLDQAVKASILTPDEAAALKETRDLVKAVIDVDDFAPEELTGPNRG